MDKSMSVQNAKVSYKIIEYMQGLGRLCAECIWRIKLRNDTEIKNIYRACDVP